MPKSHPSVPFWFFSFKSIDVLNLLQFPISWCYERERTWCQGVMKFWLLYSLTKILYSQFIQLEWEQDFYGQLRKTWQRTEEGYCHCTVNSWDASTPQNSLSLMLLALLKRQRSAASSCLVPRSIPSIIFLSSLILLITRFPSLRKVAYHSIEKVYLKL